MLRSVWFIMWCWWPLVANGGQALVRSVIVTRVSKAMYIHGDAVVHTVMTLAEMH